MKKLLSLALVLTMLFTIIAVPSVSAAAVTDDTADAEGFKTVYLFGYENGSTEPTGGGSNFWTNAATAVTEGDATVKDNLETVVTYAEAGIDKPVSPIGEDFGDKVHRFDYSNGGTQTVTTCIARIGNIKNQVTFESGATYRASFWIRIDDTSIEGDYAYLANPYFCIGGSTRATAAAGGSIAAACSGNRVIRRGEWVKVGMTFVANDTFVTAANKDGFGIRWNMESETYGTTVKGYLDNFQLEKLDTRTRVVEPNYFYYEGFDNAAADVAMSSNPYYNNYFIPTYPKPTDAATEPTWTTRAHIVPFGGGTPAYAIASGHTYSGGVALKNTLKTANVSGGNYISDIFHGDFTSADIGRRFEISAMVYPVSASATTAPADGGGKPKFHMGIGGSDGVGSAKYGNKYRSFAEAATTTQVEWDQWSKISTTFEVTSAYVCQTSVTDAQVATKNAYTAINGLRITQSGSSNLTTEFWTDDYIIRELKKYNITAASENTAFGTVAGSGACWEDGSITLTATPNEGYGFKGWYNGDTLVSADAELIVTNPTADATYVAKFKEPFVYPEDVLYHFGNEDSEVGIYNTWIYVNGEQDSNLDQANTMQCAVTYDSVAQYGISKPNDSGIFGDNLYIQKFTGAAGATTEDIGAMAGRFRGWEDGGSTGLGRFVSGKDYKFTWWVYPVATNIDPQPATAKIKVTIGYQNSVGLDKTFTVNVGEWNELEWTFTANDTMTTQAPGIRYDWTTEMQWACYDAIEVKEATSWQYSDTATPASWYNYLDQADAGAGGSNNNLAACSVVSYADAGIAKASEDAGDKVVKMDYSKPDYTEAKYNAAKEAGKLVNDYANMTYEEAYAHLSRPANWGGDLSLRFRDIVSANVLTLGKTYKISIKVYIAKKTDIETGNDTTSNTAVRIIGTRSGQSAEGDGKNVAKSVPFGQWTEVSYTFKATEAGVDFAPSLKVELKQTPPKVIPSIVYIDDVRVDQIHVDDLDLVIEDGATEVTATATVYDIKSGDTVNAIVIIAGYDADGKLVSVSFSNGGASKALAVGDTLDATYTKAETVDSYVAFLWDDLTNIRPYVLPVPLSTEVTE